MQQRLFNPLPKRLIKCVRRDSNGEVTHFGYNAKKKLKFRTKNKIMKDILKYKYQYIIGSGKNQTELVVILKSNPDSSTRNNIESLPNCEL